MSAVLTARSLHARRAGQQAGPARVYIHDHHTSIPRIVSAGSRASSRRGGSPASLFATRAAASDETEAVGIDVERIERVERELEEFKDDTPTFADLGVDGLLLPGLAAGGLETPSPIQEAAVPAILKGGNCAVSSYTGSGKTLAYLLPAMTMAFRRAEQIYKTRSEGWSVQALVVAPSQELAMQIVRAARALLPEDVRPAVQQLIGGANPLRQREALLKHRPLIVVGTPGRLSEMMRGAALQLHRCPILILDEADQLLAPNFSEDLAHIVAHAGKKIEGGRQTVLVSATLSASVLRKFEKWCPAPAFVTAGGAAPHLAEGAGDGTASAADGAPAWGWGAKGWEGPASEAAPRTRGAAGGAEGEALVPTLPPSLQHVYVVADPRHRVDALRRCVHALGAGKALVFMNWQQRLRDAQHKLEARNMPVASLHGEMAKQARQSTLEAFARGEQRVLLVSDVVARGIDVPGVDAVFNLELPSNAAHYAHRAGRTGRMGAPGVVVSVAAPTERFVIERLSHRLGVPILEAHVENGEFIIGPPPPPSKKPKRRPAADDAEAADGGAAAGAPAAKQQQQQQQQQQKQKAPAAGAGAGEWLDEVDSVDNEDDYDEVIEDDGDEDPDRKLAEAREAAAKGKLDRGTLARLEAFLEQERRIAAGGGEGGASGGGAPAPAAAPAGGRGGGGRRGGGRGGRGGRAAARGGRGRVGRRAASPANA